MADHRITDFVDQAAIDSLQRLKQEMTAVKDAYNQVASELVKGLKVSVDGIDQLEKLTKDLAALQQQAAEATQRHSAALNEQNRIVANTTNTISRQLMEQEKVNEKTRDAYTRQKEVKDVLTQAVSSYADMTKRLAEISLAQEKLNDAKRREKKLLDEGKISQDQYTSALSAIIKQQQALAAEKSQLEGYTRSEAKENANASSSYNAMSQELARLKKAYRELDEEGRNSEIGQRMLAEIKELGAHLKDMDASLGDFHRNVGDYAIACNNGVVVTEDLNRVIGLQAGTIAGCIEQNKALEDAKAKLDITDTNYAATLDRINGKIAENNARISDVSTIMGKAARSVGEAAEQNKLLGEALKLIDVTSEGAKGKIDAINKKMAENNRIIQENTAGAQSVKRDLKEMILEISTLTLQYRSLSEEEKASAQGQELAKHIQDLTEKAGKLRDAINDTNNAITNAASDTRGFDQITAGVQLAVDGFGLATGAAEMLGISEGNLIEIQTKLQAAFVAGNAVTRIQAALQKESALMQGVYAIKTKAAAVAENIKTAAVGKGVVATKAAAVAQAVFNKIAAANPYVILAMAILTVVGALVALSSGNDEAAKAQERLNDEMKKTNAAIQHIKDRSDFNIAIAEAAGESEEAIHKMRLEAARAANELAYLNLQNVMADKNHTKEQYEEAVRMEQETYDRVKQILDEGTVKYIASLHKKEKELGDHGKRTQKQTVKTAQEIELATMKFRKQSLSDQLAAAEEFSDEWVELTKDLANTTHGIQILELKSQVEKELADIATSYEGGKISLEEFERACETIREEAALRTEALTTKLADDLQATDDKIVAHKKALLEKEIEDLENAYSAKGAIENARFAERQAQLKEQYAKDLAAAKDNAEERERITKEYEENVAKAAEDFAVKQAQSQIDMYNAILAKADLSAKEREDISTKLAKAQADLADATADREIAAIEREVKAEEDAAKATQEAYKKRMEAAGKWLAKIGEGLNAVSDLASAIYDGKIQQIEDEQEAQEEAADAEKERISDLVEKKVITEEEGEARKRAAEAKSAKKQEELEKKKQELQYKQAVWDKANSVAQATIATAVAITKVMPNFVLAAIAGAMGAVQIATILATPIPKYAKGTKDHPGGLAVVGDGGREEIVAVGDKMYLTPDKPTIVDMPKGAQVFPDADRLLVDSINVAPSLIGKDAPAVVVNNDYTDLKREVVVLGNLIKRLTKAQQRSAYRSQYEQFKLLRDL